MKLQRTQHGAKSGGRLDRRPPRAMPPQAPQDAPSASPAREPAPYNPVLPEHVPKDDYDDDDESPRRVRRAR